MTRHQRMNGRPLIIAFLLNGILCCVVAPNSRAEEKWPRHTIDDSLKGADGVRLGDFNGDGLQDVVTGWEESGVVRLYLNPGPDKSTQPWPRVTVGTAKSPEDAVPFDINGDGRLDVISCHEGKQKQVLVHVFEGTDTSQNALLKQSNWKSKAIRQLNGQQWMFADPVKLRKGPDAIVFGSKGKNASLTMLFPSPGEPFAEHSKWRPRKLRSCGWIMSIQTMDMDADGDIDIVFSDRKSRHRCVGWLEQPNSDPATSDWPQHTIGATQFEPMFIDARPERILVATRQSKFLEMRRNGDSTWKTTSRANPIDVPFGKAIRQLSADSIILTANTHADSAKTKQPGVWLQRNGKKWQPMSQTVEGKFDRMELIDLDGDGDLDMMTCEERKLLGVVWYENPGIRSQAPFVSPGN